MHFCTAIVQIAGDRDQTVFRDRFTPISWPEVELLRTIHGDEAVLDVRPFVRIDQAPRAERERLVLRYGKEYADATFGQGRGLGNIEIEAPEATIAHGAKWKNPITGLEAIVGGEEPAMDEPPIDMSRLKPKPAKQAESTP